MGWNASTGPGIVQHVKNLEALNRRLKREELKQRQWYRENLPFKMPERMTMADFEPIPLDKLFKIKNKKKK